MLELEKVAGGTARSGQGEPVGYPWGAHYLPVPFQENTELISLLDEMSLIEGRGRDGELIVSEQYLCREPEERLFFKGRWYEGLYANVGATEEDKRNTASFKNRSTIGSIGETPAANAAFVVPVGMCSTDAEVTALDKISFAEWLRQNGFNSERLIWYCDYACRDDYGSKLDQTSAWAGLFYFCSRVRKVGVESQPFITFPEGNGHFVNHFFEAVKENVRPATGRCFGSSSDRGRRRYLYRRRQLRGFHCRKCRSMPRRCSLRRYVIRGFRDDAPFAANEFQHNAWWVANLFLKDRPKPRFAKDFPLAWDNVFYDSPSLGYVTATHQKEIDYGPTILTYYYPMCREENGRTKLFNYDWHISPMFV